MTISVSNPTGENEAAWKIYNDEGVFRYIQFSGSRGQNGCPYGSGNDGGFATPERLKSIEARIEQILNKYPNTVYGKLLRKIRQAPEKEAQPQTSAREIWDRAIKDLEAKRYDVKGFKKDYPKEYNEYLNASAALFDRLCEKDVPEEEFFRQISENYKSFIKEHLKPLSEDDWKRRSAVYADEEKEQAMKSRQELEEWKHKNMAEIQKLQQNRQPY